MDMKHSSVRLTDLPDEILLIIFRKLRNTELLYCLMDLDPRFDGILHESIFTNRLSFVEPTSNCWDHPSSITSYYVYLLRNRILDRHCEHILPKINQKIQWLELKSSEMERILLAANYPNLSGLTLYIIHARTALQVFSDGNHFTSTYKNQISSLIIDIDRYYGNRSAQDVNADLFTYIISAFTKLRFLRFGRSDIWDHELSFDNSSPTVTSSTILELQVHLSNFHDCLVLLDGRFNQLRALHVHVFSFRSSQSGIESKAKLPNLKWFSLYSKSITKYYCGLVVPLLQRMSNVETINLSLDIRSDAPFIDGHHLRLNIISHLPLLNEFAFNIRSETSFYNQNNIPSNEYIQQTFGNFPNKQIISCVDYFQDSQRSLCHFYSYPYPSQLTTYGRITNNFPGGLFQSVRKVSLEDERPFEHEFFRRISQSFPLMETLYVTNKKAQKNNKRFGKAPNPDEDSLITEYPHLKIVSLNAHKDYYKQFLFDDRSCLPNGISVSMDYRLAKEVTHNFTSNAARKNCAKIGCAHFVNKSECPDHMKDYFPGVKNVDYLSK